MRKGRRQDSKTSLSKKRNCHFNDWILREFPLIRSGHDETISFCTLCSSFFTTGRQENKADIASVQVYLLLHPSSREYNPLNRRMIWLYRRVCLLTIPSDTIIESDHGLYSITEQNVLPQWQMYLHSLPWDYWQKITIMLTLCHCPLIVQIIKPLPKVVRYCKLESAYFEAKLLDFVEIKGKTYAEIS